MLMKLMVSVICDVTMLCVYLLAIIKTEKVLWCR